MNLYRGLWWVFNPSSFFEEDDRKEGEFDAADFLSCKVTKKVTGWRKSRVLLNNFHPKKKRIQSVTEEVRNLGVQTRIIYFIWEGDVAYPCQMFYWGKNEILEKEILEKH